MIILFTMTCDTHIDCPGIDSLAPVVSEWDLNPGMLSLCICCSICHAAPTAGNTNVSDCLFTCVIYVQIEPRLVSMISIALGFFTNKPGCQE